MDVTSIWQAKTDDEVAAAFTTLDQYTPEVQAAIRAEYERRSLESRASESATVSSAPVSAADEQAALRRMSLNAAQAHLRELSREEPTAARNRAATSDIRQEPLLPDALRRSGRNDSTSRYEYKVVPFIGQSRGSLSADDVANQLERVIAQNAAAGWEFCQLSDVNIEVQPGCIAGLFGASVHYARFDQLIFRRAGRA